MPDFSREVLGNIDVIKYLYAFLFVMPRLYLFFLVIPLMPDSMVGNLVRFCILAVLSFPILPVIAEGLDPQEMTFPVVMLVVLKEGMLGYLAGFPIAILFWAIQSVGFLIDNQRGASMSDLMDPLSNESTTPLGMFFLQIAIVCFFSSFAFLYFLKYLYQSYIFWPPLEFFPRLISEHFPVYFLGKLDQLQKFSTVLVAPAMILMLMAELGLALVNRFAQNLSVFVVAMPVKSLIAVYILLPYLTFLFTHVIHWNDLINEAWAGIREVLR